MACEPHGESKGATARPWTPFSKAGVYWMAGLQIHFRGHQGQRRPRNGPHHRPSPGQDVKSRARRRRAIVLQMAASQRGDPGTRPPTEGPRRPLMFTEYTLYVPYQGRRPC